MANRFSVFERKPDNYNNSEGISEGVILFLFDLSLTNRNCFPNITIVTSSTD